MEIQTRTVEANGIRLNVLEAGEGPLVILAHGFPELGFSWRHQVPALAAAGYHVVVPDMRGYGRSSRPADIGAYAIDELTRDLVSLAGQYGAERAVYIGHDWGAIVVWNLAILHAEQCAAVAGLSVPFIPRGAVPPIEAFRSLFGDSFFYILYFQEPGVADAELNANPGEAIQRIIAATAGGPDGDEMLSAFTPGAPGGGEGLLDRLPLVSGPPSWMTHAEMDEFVARFTETGFTGGLNYYRNLDHNWQITAPVANAKVTMPAAFLTGSQDVGAIMPMPGPEWVPDLRVNATIDGAGHWLHQQLPDQVNEHLLGFLGQLERDASGWR